MIREPKKHKHKFTREVNAFLYCEFKNCYKYLVWCPIFKKYYGEITLDKP